MCELCVLGDGRPEGTGASDENKDYLISNIIQFLMMTKSEKVD